MCLLRSDAVHCPTDWTSRALSASMDQSDVGSYGSFVTCKSTKIVFAVLQSQITYRKIFYHLLAYLSIYPQSHAVIGILYNVTAFYCLVIQKMLSDNFKMCSDT